VREAAPRGERAAASGAARMVEAGGAHGGGVRHGVEACGAAVRQPIFFYFV